MWLLYLFLAVLAGIAWSAMRSSTKTKAKQAAIRQKLESSGFPMSASYVDVLGDGGIAQNTRGDRFLLARRDADNQIRTRSLASTEILAVGLIEDGIVLHEVHQGRGEVPYGERKLVPPPDPNIEAARKFMERFGMDTSKLDASSLSGEVENLMIAIVIDDGSVDPYDHPFYLRFIGGEGTRLIHQRGTKPYRTAAGKSRHWLSLLANAMEAEGSNPESQPAKITTMNDRVGDDAHPAPESLAAQLGALRSTDVAKPSAELQPISIDANHTIDDAWASQRAKAFGGSDES